MAACYLLRVNSYLPVPCNLQREDKLDVDIKEGWSVRNGPGRKTKQTESWLCSSSALRPLVYSTVLWFSVLGPVREWADDTFQMPLTYQFPRRCLPSGSFGTLQLTLDEHFLLSSKHCVLGEGQGKGLQWGATLFRELTYHFLRIKSLPNGKEILEPTLGVMIMIQNTKMRSLEAFF